MTSTTPDVLIIGGGSVGASCALELARRGAQTVLIERGATVGSGCSYGTAGLISPRHATPLANPTALRQGLRWMLDESSPFALRLRPRLIPWLIRFALASTTAHARRSGPVMRSLTAKGLEMHEEYARSGMDTGFQHHGCVSVYETEAGFNFGRREAEHENTAAFSSRVLDHAELRELGIELGPHAVGAVFFGEDAHCDSYRFVSAVGSAAANAGAVVRTSVEVRRLLRSGRQVVGVETSAGTLHPREVVLAAGAWSGHLARQIGVFLPIEGGKGYHVDLAAAPSDPHVPVYFHESKVIATPLDGRLRIAGTLELAGLDMSINTARLATVRRSAERAMNGVAGRKSVETWSGLRPCTPDGLPVIGRPRVLDNVVIATGHAMKGVALGPITGRLVAELVSGAQPSFDLRPLRGERFLSLLQSANPE